MWPDFITAFRPHTIRSWTRSMITEWRDLFTKRGIFIDNNRSSPPVEAIIDLLFRVRHIGPKEVTNQEDGHLVVTDEYKPQEESENEARDGKRKKRSPIKKTTKKRDIEGQLNKKGRIMIRIQMILMKMKVPPVRKEMEMMTITRKELGRMSVIS